MKTSAPRKVARARNSLCGANANSSGAVASLLGALFARLHFVGEMGAPLLFILSVGMSGQRPTPAWRRCSAAPHVRRRLDVGLLGCGVTALGGVPADAYEHGPLKSMAMAALCRDSVSNGAAGTVTVARRLW